MVAGVGRWRVGGRRIGRRRVRGWWSVRLALLGARAVAIALLARLGGRRRRGRRILLAAQLLTVVRPTALASGSGRVGLMGNTAVLV